MSVVVLLTQAGVVAGSVLATLPVGEQLRQGVAEVSRSGNRMTILQRSASAKFDWTAFSVGAGHHLEIQQPSPEAFIVHRVVGDSVPSRIDGTLNANGRVYLLNPNGILIGRTARIDAAGLVAAAMTTDEMTSPAPPVNLVRDQYGRVTNEGVIRIRQGGVLTLAGAGEVAQGGVVWARRGTVGIGQGTHATLDEQGTLVSVNDYGLVKIQDAVRASGVTEVPGGRVEIKTGASTPVVLGPLWTAALSIDRPLSLRFSIEDKRYDGTDAARAESESATGIDLSGSNVKLLTRYRFDTPAAGRGKPVTAEAELTGFRRKGGGRASLRMETPVGRPGRGTILSPE